MCYRQHNLGTPANVQLERQQSNVTTNEVSIGSDIAPRHHFTDLSISTMREILKIPRIDALPLEVWTRDLEKGRRIKNFILLLFHWFL